MPSPFPGMNPYLEQDDAWRDFHQSFLPLVREILLSQVQPAYFVKVEEHVYIHEPPGDQRRLLGHADVSVHRGLPRAVQGPAGALAEAPVHGFVPMAVDIERDSFLEVRDRRSRELVTVIELLSPSNKMSGSDREQYLSKRRQLLASAVHLVELDLLRGGQRMPVEGLAECDYCVLVSRAEERPRVDLWPLRLRDRLPIIPIPLRQPDPDAHLDLQAALHRLYDAAGYIHYIYASEPEPSLSPEDTAWARQLLPETA